MLFPLFRFNSDNLCVTCVFMRVWLKKRQGSLLRDSSNFLSLFTLPLKTFLHLSVFVAGSAAVLEESAPRCFKWVESGVCCNIPKHLPSQHFKDEDAQSPPVHCSAMTFALDDLRGQVLGSSTQSPGPDQTEADDFETCDSK